MFSLLVNNEFLNILKIFSILIKKLQHLLKRILKSYIFLKIAKLTVEFC
jgi:hypothetical protein